MVRNQVQYELSQAPRIPRARLVADSYEELAKVTLIIRERARTRPTLLPHPLAETSDQRRRGHRGLVDRLLNNPPLLEVGQEETSAGDPPPTPEGGASSGGDP